VTTSGSHDQGWRVFEAHPRHGKAVREWITGIMDAGHSTVDPAAVALAVSELFANAVLHGPVAGRVMIGCLMWPGGIRVAVCDSGGPAIPQPRDPASDEESARGLRVVSALATRWNSFRTDHAQVVWCELGKPRTAADPDDWPLLKPQLTMLSKSECRRCDAGKRARRGVGAVRPKDL
jgi:anti-sigma regulatory factor (Ser/Thr protein kinase)